ncbi:MAG: hypothetical protein ACXVGC_10185 [Mycobacteriaceae bacterium]
METWITSVFYRKGKRVAKRHVLNVPLDAATGNFDRLSDRALNDLITDLQTEKLRRFTNS